MWKIQTFILIHISILLGYPQTSNNFFHNLNISINDSVSYPDSAYTKEILIKANDSKINYTISAMAFRNHIAHTKVRIPQTLVRNDVIKQCVLYFYLLENEVDRKREYLEVYPFFMSLNSRPDVIVRYEGDGNLKIRFRKWENIPVPPKPTSVEAEIYNQVIDLSYNQKGVFETVDVKIFKIVADNNDLDVSVVNNIYRKVLLWQKSQ